ncbi:hypothetical protein DPMN_103259 [Dreissena polymorpha]|uniref:Uncharacterized protein n=1 Tax=Dreissena polymorpha TaxID=45954 RepID=A0A9D4HAT7_DREPO|nr:hypothetical protein DPMN_103259 [Dreissena polymorpha]
MSKCIRAIYECACDDPSVCMHVKRSTLARECLHTGDTPFQSTLHLAGDRTSDLWIVKPESETTDLQIRLIRRKKYVAIHGRLHQAWDDYEEEKLTTTDLLRIISHINALGPSTAVHHMLDDDEF